MPIPSSSVKPTSLRPSLSVGANGACLHETTALMVRLLYAQENGVLLISLSEQVCLAGCDLFLEILL